MSTRFILIELEDPTTLGGMAKAISIWELPSTEELGHVALTSFKTSVDKGISENHNLHVGEAILARIKGKSSENRKG